MIVCVAACIMICIPISDLLEIVGGMEGKGTLASGNSLVLVDSSSS